MKKISIALAALILAVCSVSCGSKKTSEEELSSALISAYEAHETAENETSAITEIIETDPFKGVSITIPDTGTAYTGFISYPSNFMYNVECDNETVAPIFENDSYDDEIIESNSDNVTIRVTIKEDVVSGLEKEQGIRLVPTSQNFTIDIKQYRMDLISEKQLTSDNTNSLLEGIQSAILEEIEWENSHIESTNEWRNEDEKESLINADLTLEKCFMDDVDSDNIHYGMESAFYAVFKNKDNSYFVGKSVPKFKNEKLEEENTKYEIMYYSPENQFTQHLVFPTLDDAVNGIPANFDTEKPVREIK